MGLPIPPMKADREAILVDRVRTRPTVRVACGLGWLMSKESSGPAAIVWLTVATGVALERSVACPLLRSAVIIKCKAKVGQNCVPDFGGSRQMRCGGDRFQLDESVFSERLPQPLI